MEFNRYDICEAYNLLAIHYSLHDVHIRLCKLGFKSSYPAEFYAGLTKNGQAIYDHHAALLDVGLSSINSEFKG